MAHCIIMTRIIVDFKRNNEGQKTWYNIYILLKNKTG